MYLSPDQKMQLYDTNNSHESVASKNFVQLIQYFSPNI